MGRNRSIPKLRLVRNKYYCADVYLPDGKRTTVSFGIVNGRTVGEIYVTFGKWLDLYRQQPHKVLSYSTPYDAIEQILNPTKAPTVNELLEKYESYTKKTLNHGTNSNGHPANAHPSFGIYRRGVYVYKLRIRERRNSLYQ